MRAVRIEDRRHLDRGRRTEPDLLLRNRGRGDTVEKGAVAADEEGDESGADSHEKTADPAKERRQDRK